MTKRLFLHDVGSKSINSHPHDQQCLSIESFRIYLFETWTSCTEWVTKSILLQLPVELKIMKLNSNSTRQIEVFIVTNLSMVAESMRVLTNCRVYLSAMFMEIKVGSSIQNCVSKLVEALRKCRDFVPELSFIMSQWFFCGGARKFTFELSCITSDRSGPNRAETT